MTAATLRLARLFLILAGLLVLGTGHRTVGQDASSLDTVEFLSGTELQGKILQIRKDQQEFDIQIRVGNQELKRTYPYAKVHAVTFGGKRFVLTPKDAPTEDTGNAGPTKRSDAEVRELIDTVGSKLPEWYDSTTMSHPETLDLSWPLKADGPWNESKNVGQYIWGRVNPNPKRWRSGIKLVHEIADSHASNPTLLTRDHEKLGELYFVLLQDYARAAFHLQKGNASVDRSNGVYLAECYWRLGSEKMALAMLAKGQPHFDAIKLFGEMGRIAQAISLAEKFGQTGFFNEAFLNAGDALRGAGRYDEAIKYYQRLLTLDRARNKDYKDRFHARARGAIEAIELFDRADVGKIPDGTYRDSSIGYNGPIEVEVAIADKRITNVRVTKHQEKQFYAAITDTTKQIVDGQSVTGVDGTSGATITSQAIIHAAARAMASGSP